MVSPAIVLKKKAEEAEKQKTDASRKQKEQEIIERLKKQTKNFNILETVKLTSEECEILRKHLEDNAEEYKRIEKRHAELHEIPEGTRPKREGYEEAARLQEFVLRKRVIEGLLKMNETAK
jgi:CTP synthase (UTP-ammonia lyase)